MDCEAVFTVLGGTGGSHRGKNQDTHEKTGWTHRSHIPQADCFLACPVRCSLLACRAHLRRQVKSNLTSKWTAGARTHCVTDSLPSTTTPATRDLVAGSSARRPTCTPARQVKSSQLDLTLRQVSHSEIADTQQNSRYKAAPGPLKNREVLQVRGATTISRFCVKDLQICT